MAAQILAPRPPRVNRRKNQVQRALDVGSQFYFPEAEFETLLSMLKIQDVRFQPTMKRVAAAIAAAGAMDINDRLADQLGITRRQAGALLRALLAIGSGDAR